MNSINLYFLSKIEDCEEFAIYEKRLSMRAQALSVREHERASLHAFVSCASASGASLQDFDSFYYNYSISQIGKEFDLLKITPDSILNIELKSQEIEFDKIETQLRRNKHYLRHLSRQIYSFTYVASTNEVYQLNGGECLDFSDMDTLLNIMHQLSGIYPSDITQLFRASEFLVSPLNTPEKFISNEYFLTKQQEEFKQTIFSFMRQSTARYYKITGLAGTGKTLLLYDIAKECSKLDYCCVIHCGSLSDGHNFLNSHLRNVEIISAKTAQSNFDFSGFKYIFVDEAHRLRKAAYAAIVAAISGSDKFCFWSLDANQTLSKAEQRRDISGQIDQLAPLKSFQLTKKIRTNQEMANFIQLLLNLQDARHFKEYPNVSLVYANTADEAKEILDYYRHENYTFINYTPSIYYPSTLDQYSGSLSTHSVIGQEFDNVIMILDRYFTYDEEKKLRAVSHPNPDYLYRKMLIQGVTRVREKLCLLIVDNMPLFQNILSIL